MSDEFETEPVRGLPDRLPPGEHILWQGEPDWRAFARQVLHVRAVALYFGLLMLWRLLAGLESSEGVGGAILGTLVLVPIALAGIGLLAFYAWLVARTTVYTLTNRRLVIRAGIALPKAVNVPFAIVESVDLGERAGGVGDIALALSGPDRIAYLHLWPHVRPWRLAKAQPALRAIPRVGQVGEILAGALETTAGTTPKLVRTPKRPANESAPRHGDLKEAV